MGVAEFHYAIEQGVHAVFAFDGVVSDAEQVQDGLGIAAHGDLGDVELADLAAQVHENRDRRAGRQAQAGDAVDAVAKPAGLHEHSRVTAHGVAAHGDTDGLLLTGAGHQMEKRVLGDDAGHLVYGYVGDVRDERRVPLFQGVDYGFRPRHKLALLGISWGLVYRNERPDRAATLG